MGANEIFDLAENVNSANCSAHSCHFLAFSFVLGVGVPFQAKHLFVYKELRAQMFEDL